MKQKKDNRFIMWKTLAERAAFGFRVQVEMEPTEYCNVGYLESLISQERVASQNFDKILRAFIILNIMALMYLQGIKTNFIIFGNQIPEIPAAPQVLCFLIGINLFGLSLSTLNILTLSRMRDMIVRKMKATDLPGMTLAHMKGDVAWVDLLTPRMTGYKSGASHGLVSGGMLIVLLSFYVAIFIAGGAGLLATFNFGFEDRKLGFDWSSIMALAGLVMGYTGVLLFLLVLFVPFRFKLDPKDLQNIT